MTNPKLALIPSGYKSGKVYSILPNDATGDFDFERQSIGTRVRKDGLIEEAKTSGSITNELLYSEDFTQSNWFNSSSTDSISTVVSPDGASLSTLLTSTASNGGLADFNEWSTAVKTASIYVKKNTSSTFRIANLSSPSNDIVFNLDSGTVQSIGGNFSGQIISLPNGWFRCVGTHQGTSSQTLGFTIPTSGQSVYIWGAMLSEGALSDYIKTEGTTETKTVETFTDVPRLDWLNSNCPSLLLEPQRTNLHTYSESSTSKTTQNVTLTDNSETSPDGEFNAIKVTDNSVNFRHRFWANNVSVTSGTQYTISFYVKKNSPNRYIYINAGILGTNGSFSLDDQSTTGSVQVFETLNNEWYRIGLTGTAPTTQTTIWFLQMQLGTTDANYIGDGSSFYVWGLQFEQGSYPTSYIKTTTGQATRQKDQCLNGGDSDLFDITEGTFFVDANNFGTPYLDYNMITLSDGGNNFVRFLYESSRIRTSVYNGATQQDYFITGVNDNERNKVAITFKENEFKTYFNGVLKDTDTSGVVPINFDRLNFASQSGTSRHFEGKVYDTRVYDRVLTDAEAIELTT